MESDNPLILKEEEFTRDGYLSRRAEFLAGERAKALAWAAFQIDRGRPAVEWHWRLGCGLHRGAGRKGDSWYVVIMRGWTGTRENIAAEVFVNDRTGACEVKPNPDFVWTSRDGLYTDSTAEQDEVFE